MTPGPNFRTGPTEADRVERSRRSGWHRGIVALVVLVLATSIPTASGSAADEPVRYHDDVFATVHKTSNIRYGRAVRSDDGAEIDLVLDVYEPVGDTLAARPAIVWVHGGGFAGGNRNDDQAATLAERFAHLGYVTVSIDYRLLQSGGCDGSVGVSAACTQAAVDGIADGQAAVRWLRANAADHRVDVDRIGIGGISAGAIIATGVGLLGDAPAPGSNPGFPSTVVAFASVSGGLPGGAGATADDAPGILFSGTADVIVPFDWSVETADALNAAGVDTELVTFDGAGHVPWGEHAAEITARTIDFFAVHLVGAVAPVDAGPTTTAPVASTAPATTPPPSGAPPALPTAPAAAPVASSPGYTG